MCAVCREWELGKLTNDEAKRALAELISMAKPEDLNHYQDIWYDVEEDELNKGDGS